MGSEQLLYPAIQRLAAILSWVLAGSAVAADIGSFTSGQPHGSASNGTPVPMMIRGKKATMLFQGPDAVIEPQPQTNPEGKREELARTRGGSQQELRKDLVRCVRARAT